MAYSVSYTHLDVYKRQAYDTCWYAIDGSGVSEKLNKFQKPTNSNKSYISAVSYTHLDVYKRQDIPE